MVTSNDEVSALLGDAPPQEPLEDKRPRASYATLGGFFIAGLINNFGYVVMNSAALKLIGNDLPPSLVLLANILPGFLAQLAFPWFQDRIPYIIRVWLTVVLGCASFVIAALGGEVYVRLFGVVLGSVGSCIGEMTFLAYSSKFHKNTVAAWSSGTGGAGIFGALAYYVMTSKIDMSNTLALLVSSWVPLLIAVSFMCVIAKPPVDADSDSEGAAPVGAVLAAAAPTSTSTMTGIIPPLSMQSTLSAADAASAEKQSGNAQAYGDLGVGRRSNVRYSSNSEYDGRKIGVDDDMKADTARYASTSSMPASINLDDPLYAGGVREISGVWRSDTALPTELPLTAKRRLSLMWQLMPYMLPLALVYFAEYLINQSVDAVWNFKTFSFAPTSDDQYKLLQVIYQVGVFISRSSVNVVRLKNIIQLQLPAFFQCAFLAFLSIAAVYGFVPSFWIIIALTLCEGLCGGAIYVNCFYLASERFTGKAKEFCLGAISQSYGLSITLAAVVGLWYYGFLQEQANLHNPFIY